MRSLSRYGRYDFGRNAQRVRDFYTELHARLEASVPDAGTPRGRARARGTKLPVRSTEKVFRIKKRALAADKAPLNQMLNVRRHRKRRRLHEPWDRARDR